jgi:hypothetical protein
MLNGFYDEHAIYCSGECENIQNGVDDYVSYTESEHDRKFLERVETW